MEIYIALLLFLVSSLIYIFLGIETSVELHLSQRDSFDVSRKIFNMRRNKLEIHVQRKHGISLRVIQRRLGTREHSLLNRNVREK